MVSISQTQTPDAMPEEKRVYLEFIRIAACFMVLAVHTNGKIFLTMQPSPTWFVSLAYRAVYSICVCSFLTITGALLLPKQDAPRKWAERCIRAASILLVFSVFYYLYFAYKAGAAPSITAFLRTFLLYKTNTAIWYQYTLLGLLLIMPVFQRLAAALNRTELLWLLFLSLGVYGGLLFASSLFSWPPLLPNLTLALMHPIPAFLFAGYYMERYVDVTPRKFRLAVLLFFVLAAGKVLLAYFLYRLDGGASGSWSDAPFTGMYPPTALSSFCFYIAVKYIFTHIRISPVLERAICRLGRLTLLIYLLGDLAIDLLAPVYDRLCLFLHPLFSMLLWEALIFAVCAAAAAVLRQIPFLKKRL